MHDVLSEKVAAWFRDQLCESITSQELDKFEQALRAQVYRSLATQSQGKTTHDVFWSARSGPSPDLAKALQDASLIGRPKVAEALSGHVVRVHDGQVVVQAGPNAKDVIQI